MQGYFFARPADVLLPEGACHELFARLVERFHADTGAFQARRREKLTPYLAALDSAVRLLAAGTAFAAAVRDLIALDCTQRCYLIGSNGAQLGANLEADRNVSARDRRLEPMRPTAGTNWQTKPYFQRAVHAPGRIQITRPYLSVTGPRLCVTLSLGFVAEGGLRVLCADLDFAGLAGEDLSFGSARSNRV